jgi:hypothetical protein
VLERGEDDSVETARDHNGNIEIRGRENLWSQFVARPPSDVRFSKRGVKHRLGFHDKCWEAAAAEVCPRRASEQR